MPSVLSLLAGLLSVSVAVAVVLARPQTPAKWVFLAGIVAISLEQFCHFAALRAPSLEQMIFWERASISLMSLLPAAWLSFTLAYARGNAGEFLQKWKPVVVLLGIAPVALAIWGWPNLIIEAGWTDQPGNWVFPIGTAGKAVHASLVLGCVLALMNLEWTFRSAVGTARWRIKYAVLGLAVLFGTRVYSSSQAIAYSAGNVQLIALDALALMLCCALLVVAFVRSRLGEVDIYPSAAVLHRSFTVLLAAGYLVTVGLLATMASTFGGSEAFALQAILILIALAGLGLLCFSDKLRHAMKRFISRHFKRPSHDYRKIWPAFTERTVAVLDRQALARAVVALISETFEVLSVTLWLADTRAGKLSFGASTSLKSDGAAAASLPDEIARELLALTPVSSVPIHIDEHDSNWCQLLRKNNPAFFAKGGTRLCVPLISGGEVRGLLVVGDRVNGVPFSAEDLELLKCLGDQTAAAVRNLGVSEQVAQAKELEAFQTMSAFLMHDLKNTVSTLSLTLKNLPIHFENPAFRKDALRALANSVDRVNELIGRLAAFRTQFEIRKTPANLNDIVAAVTQTLGFGADKHVSWRPEPLPTMLIDVKHIESVVTNLLLNAREAAGESGLIRLETSVQDSWAKFAVSDNGCGMSPAFMANGLFKPFRSTKKTGLGIGMFQARAIVDAHGGKISVQSEPGEGTTVQVLLPLGRPV